MRLKFRVTWDLTLPKLCACHDPMAGPKGPSKFMWGEHESAWGSRKFWTNFLAKQGGLQVLMMLSHDSSLPSHYSHNSILCVQDPGFVVHQNWLLVFRCVVWPMESGVSWFFIMLFFLGWSVSLEDGLEGGRRSMANTAQSVIQAKQPRLACQNFHSSMWLWGLFFYGERSRNGFPSHWGSYGV